MLWPHQQSNVKASDPSESESLFIIAETRLKDFLFATKISKGNMGYLAKSETV